MGTVIQEVHKISFQKSNLPKCSKIYSNYSIMSGIKIAIIFMAIAGISVPANAVPLSYEECEEKLKECEIVVGHKNGDGSYDQEITNDRECVQKVALECPELKIKIRPRGQEGRVARNADYCKEELEACGSDFECIAKVLKNCPGLNPNKAIINFSSFFYSFLFKN